MIDPNTISLPDGPVRNAASISQIKRHLQGTVDCLLRRVVSDDICGLRVSGNRVLCSPCRDRLLAAGVTSLAFAEGRQVVDVAVNESTLIDVLMRIA